ncbi:unnamed protein product [Prunus armeniaca]
MELVRGDFQRVHCGVVGDFRRVFAKAERFPATSTTVQNKMSDTESDYSRSPRAFDGESALASSTAGLDSADFEETEGREVTEVSTDTGSTSSVEVVGADDAHPSTFDHRMGEAEANVLVADPRESVKMRIPGPLESLGNPKREVVFFTDVFKHGLRLPLRHSVQKILAAIGYAPGQFNPNFWITLLGTVTTFNIAGDGEHSYEQFAHLYSVTRAKSADQGGWVQLNYLSAGQKGHFVVVVSTSQKTWRRRRVLVSGAWESAPGVIVERHIPTSFQTVGRPMGCLSLKRPIATKREIKVIKRVRSRIAEKGRVHKALLDYKNLFKAGLISEPEYLRRKEEEEEERQSNGKRVGNVRSDEEDTRVARPKTKPPRQAKGASAQEGTPGDRRRERRVAEADLIREAHLQVTGKRVIEGALDVTPLPKRPRGPNEEAAILVSDEEDAEAEPVNITCPRKVAGRAFHLQATANMEMWLSMKRAINAAEHVQKKLAKVERAAMDAEEARAKAEEAKEAERRSRATELETAKKQAIAEYRNSPEFVALLDKEVMEQCEDLIYRFKRFNADKKLNLNFVRDPPPLPERVTEDMVEAYLEAYLEEDAEVDSLSGSESDGQEEESTSPAEQLSARDDEGPAPPASATEVDPPTP